MTPKAMKIHPSHANRAHIERILVYAVTAVFLAYSQMPSASLGPGTSKDQASSRFV